MCAVGRPLPCPPGDVGAVEPLNLIQQIVWDAGFSKVMVEGCQAEFPELMPAETDSPTDKWFYFHYRIKDNGSLELHDTV